MPRKPTASQRATRYQNTLRALKDKYGIDHKAAQRSYRELRSLLGDKSPSRNDVVKHPRYSKRAVDAGTRAVKKERAISRKKTRASDSNRQVLEQAIEALATRSPGVRAAITSTEVTDTLVKITIRGKDYTKVIKGHITDRKGSKILSWRWEQTTTGKRKR